MDSQYEDDISHLVEVLQAGDELPPLTEERLNLLMLGELKILGIHVSESSEGKALDELEEELLNVLHTMQRFNLKFRGNCLARLGILCDQFIPEGMDSVWVVNKLSWVLAIGELYGHSEAEMVRVGRLYFQI